MQQTTRPIKPQMVALESLDDSAHRHFSVLPFLTVIALPSDSLVGA